MIFFYRVLLIKTVVKSRSFTKYFKKYNVVILSVELIKIKITTRLKWVLNVKQNRIALIQ